MQNNWLDCPLIETNQTRWIKVKNKIKAFVISIKCCVFLWNIVLQIFYNRSNTHYRLQIIYIFINIFPPIKIQFSELLMHNVIFHTQNRMNFKLNNVKWAFLVIILMHFYCIQYYFVFLYVFRFFLLLFSDVTINGIKLSLKLILNEISICIFLWVLESGFSRVLHVKMG